MGLFYFISKKWWVDVIFNSFNRITPRNKGKKCLRIIFPIWYLFNWLIFRNNQFNKDDMGTWWLRQWHIYKPIHRDKCLIYLNFWNIYRVGLKTLDLQWHNLCMLFYCSVSVYIEKKAIVQKKQKKYKLRKSQRREKEANTFE